MRARRAAGEEAADEEEEAASLLGFSFFVFKAQTNENSTTTIAVLATRLAARPDADPAQEKSEDTPFFVR